MFINLVIVFATLALGTANVKAGGNRFVGLLVAAALFVTQSVLGLLRLLAGTAESGGAEASVALTVAQFVVLAGAVGVVKLRDWLADKALTREAAYLEALDVRREELRNGGAR